jgi:LmbE family N-acetylglucosaminyl deacetylase
VRFLIFFLLFSFLANPIFGKPDVKYSSTEIQSALNKLGVLGSVLYIAAHPDDENQGILTYMSKGRHYRAAYLSLTRGDGGQNLLGTEKGDLLGIVRTQELLAARKIDGAQQFFTRAIDFGYSKTADETLSKWDHKTILGDVVKVIRKFRPDIIITRFTEKRGGHGHHLSSAILAEEAFHAAADPNQYPEQLKNLKPWQAKRIFWNSFGANGQRANASPILSLDLGEYSALHGLSFREIAAKSRSMHKTQGFGATPARGSSLNYFKLTAGDSVNIDIMDGIETSWKRIDPSGEILEKVSAVNANFEAHNPQALIPDLINLYKILEKQENSFWLEIKKNEVKKLLQMCSGLWLESIAFDESITRKNKIKIKTTVLNRSAFPVKLNRIKMSYSGQDTAINHSLVENTPKSFISNIIIPKNVEFSQPYWLKSTHGETMYKVEANFSGQAEGKPAMESTMSLIFDDTKIDFTIPVEYRWNDPKDGEKYKPLVIVPDVSISFSEKVFVFKDTNPREVNALVVAKKDNVSGTLKAVLPKGWKVEPGEHTFNLANQEEQATFTFKVMPETSAQNGVVKLIAESDNSKFQSKVVEIEYPHIPPQIVLQPAEAKLVKLDVTVPQKKIAYIMGSGDEIPQALQQIGMSVDLLSDEDLVNVNYNLYDAVICGVRAFNTREKLDLYQKRILKYVDDGGTWIVQHNTRFGIQVAQMGPYPITARGRDRISEEDAKMEMLIPSHAIFNYPNKITDKDFENWVQERGTYLAESWQGKLYPLLAGHDKGEPSKLGSLLYAPHGKGVFIFTAISWFRQLPAGVPGAYRLFVNLISAKQ